MKTLLLALFAGCVMGLSAAFPYNYNSYWPWSGFPYSYSPYYNPYYWYYTPFYQPSYAAGGHKQAYYGEFRGTCDGAQDGLYYVDDHSFAYCSGGQKTVQPCSEGTSNPPVTAFTAGQLYGFFDFCSVNMLASAYGFPFGGPGFKQHAPPQQHYEGPKDDHGPKHEEPKDKY